MQKICPYCFKSVIYNVGKQFSSHCANCKFRPNYQEKIEKRRQYTLKKRKNYVFPCKKCGKIYELNLTPYQFENKFYKKHCSYKCSNSKVQTPEMNSKRRLKLKGRENPKLRVNLVIRECEICKIKFESLPSQKYRTCRSEKCSSKLNSILTKARCFGGHTSKRRVSYKNKFGEIVHLHSSYEEMLAKEFDKHNILWTRPKPLKWIDDNGEEHKYYPDFYLPKYNLYLDPKNNYLLIKDENKIAKVKEQNNVKIFALSVEQLNIDAIGKLIKHQW